MLVPAEPAVTPGAPLVPLGPLAALVARAQVGDRAAFGALWERFEPKIRAYLRYRLEGRADLAEDLAGDVFTKALARLDTYRPDGDTPFSAWLYRIAHNHLVDWLRALPKRSELRLEGEPGGILPDDNRQVWCAESERAVRTVELRDALARARAALTRDQDAVIRLRFDEDRSIAATARRMGKGEDAVKQLQVRALRNLRKALGATTLAEVLT